MRYLLMAPLVLLCGCFSLVRVTTPKDKAKPIPAAPRATVKLEEAVQQEADVAHKMAGIVYVKGTSAGSTESKVLLESTDRVVTYLGKPWRGVNPYDPDKMHALHERFEGELLKFRRASHKWREDIARLREENLGLDEENQRLRVSFANLKFWFWITIIALVALCVAFPSLIPVFLSWGKKGVAALLKVLRRQMREVVGAIQKIRKDESIPKEIRDKIDDILRAYQSSDTMITVSKIKAGEE